MLRMLDLVLLTLGPFMVPTASGNPWDTFSVAEKAAVCLGAVGCVVVLPLIVFLGD